MAVENGYEETMEEKRQKRLLSNRESARRSRTKKKMYMKDLMTETTCLNERSKMLRHKAILMRENLVIAKLENDALRAQRDDIIRQIEEAKHMIILLKRFADSRNIPYPNRIQVNYPNPIQVEQTYPNPIQVEQTYPNPIQVEQTFNVEQTFSDNLWIDDVNWEMQMQPQPDVYPQTMPLPPDQPSLLPMQPPLPVVYPEHMPMLPDQPSLLPPLPQQSAPTNGTSSGAAFNF